MSRQSTADSLKLNHLIKGHGVNVQFSGMAIYIQKHH